MARVVFDDWQSFFHFLWGMLTAIGGPLGIIPLVIFWWYQNEEKERQTNTLGDWVEYFTGWLFVISLLQWFQWK